MSRAIRDAARALFVQRPGGPRKGYATMSGDDLLGPIPDRRFGFSEAQHLLNRAGFGGTRRQVETLRTMGVDAAVDTLVDYQPIDHQSPSPFEPSADIVRPLTRDQRRMIARIRAEGDSEEIQQLAAESRQRRSERRRTDRQQYQAAQSWWLQQMIATPRPLEEKLTLLWHGHFASNYRTVRDSYLLLQQNALFRRHAAGSFADLAYGIIRDPAMIVFLDNETNRRRMPNENLARELMELFTLGEGNYSEADIKEGARALTGYSYRDNDFQFMRRVHDGQGKQILGRRGDFDGEDFVRILLQNPACPMFVAYKLYKHFVADITYGQLERHSEAARALGGMADLLVKNEYRVAPVLHALFRSRHFYDASIIGNKIKSPVQLLVGTTRTLELPARDSLLTSRWLQIMGQVLFDPPSVAGWPGGRRWINTSTLFARQNLCVYLITGKHPRRKWNRQRVQYDPMGLFEGMDERGYPAVVDRLMTTMLSAGFPDKRRQQVLAFLHQRGKPVTADTVLGVLVLITGMPEYQLC